MLLGQGFKRAFEGPSLYLNESEDIGCSHTSKAQQTELVEYINIEQNKCLTKIKTMILKNLLLGSLLTVQPYKIKRRCL